MCSTSRKARLAWTDQPTYSQASWLHRRLADLEKAWLLCPGWPCNTAQLPILVAMAVPMLIRGRPDHAKDNSLFSLALLTLGHHYYVPSTGVHQLLPHQILAVYIMLALAWTHMQVAGAGLQGHVPRPGGGGQGVQAGRHGLPGLQAVSEGGGHSPGLRPPPCRHVCRCLHLEGA